MHAPAFATHTGIGCAVVDRRDYALQTRHFLLAANHRPLVGTRSQRAYGHDQNNADNGATNQERNGKVEAWNARVGQEQATQHECNDSPYSQGTESGQEGLRSEEHTSELQSLMRISYAVFCLKKQKQTQSRDDTHDTTT